MTTDSEGLTGLLLQNGYIRCNECDEVLRKIDLIEHCEREHNKIHRLSGSRQDGVESIDANNNILKDIKPENVSNPFNRKPIEANIVNENGEVPTHHRPRHSFFSSFNRENISPITPVTTTSKLAIKFPAKAVKNVSFDENIDKKSNEIIQTPNLIDFCYDGETSKNVAESTVLSNGDAPNNVGNPFKVKVEHPFDLENFNWNSEAGQIVVKAKNAQDNDENDDESMMVTLSTCCEPDAVDDDAVDVDVANDKPRKMDTKGWYFLHCRECGNNVLSGTWHEHMKRTHNQDVDPDCVPECANDNMKAAFCRKCHNVMPVTSLAHHMSRKHRFKGIIGTIIRCGPDDDAFNKMVKFGKIYAKDGMIFNGDEDKK